MTRFVLDPDEEHVTGPDGTRYGVAWAIDQQRSSVWFSLVIRSRRRTRCTGTT